MASRQPERRIPHVRDIFNTSASRPAEADRVTEVRARDDPSDQKEHQEAPQPETIERHLSMKKTIRKQLSRRLSKAFLEPSSRQNRADADRNRLNDERSVPEEGAVADEQPSSCGQPKKNTIWRRLTIKGRNINKR